MDLNLTGGNGSLSLLRSRQLGHADQSGAVAGVDKALNVVTVAVLVCKRRKLTALLSRLGLKADLTTLLSCLHLLSQYLGSGSGHPLGLDLRIDGTNWSRHAGDPARSGNEGLAVRQHDVAVDNLWGLLTGSTE